MMHSYLINTNNYSVNYFKEQNVWSKLHRKFVVIIIFCEFVEIKFFHISEMI